MKKTWAIIGGGNGGQAIAGHLASMGEAVRLFDVVQATVDALNEKGYNPINQIVGYLLTEDPTYITNYNNARSMICKIDRDELLQDLVHSYLFDK